MVFHTINLPVANLVQLRTPGLFIDKGGGPFEVSLQAGLLPYSQYRRGLFFSRDTFAACGEVPVSRSLADSPDLGHHVPSKCRIISHTFPGMFQKADFGFGACIRVCIRPEFG